MRERGQAVERVRALTGVEHRKLLVLLRIPNPHADQKSIELRFGQWIGACELVGILRGEDEEGRSEDVRCAVDGHLRFAHGFEEGRLRTRRCAVDLVGEEDAPGRWVRDETRTNPAPDRHQEPRMSVGSKSGVNCTREKPTWNTRASALASAGLPTPGTSSTSAWPPRVARR